MLLSEQCQFLWKVQGCNQEITHFKSSLDEIEPCGLFNFSSIRSNFPSQFMLPTPCSMRTVKRQHDIKINGNWLKRVFFKVQISFYRNRNGLTRERKKKHEREKSLEPFGTIICLTHPTTSLRYSAVYMNMFCLHDEAINFPTSIYKLFLLLFLVCYFPLHSPHSAGWSFSHCMQCSWAIEKKWKLKSNLVY